MKNFLIIFFIFIFPVKYSNGENSLPEADFFKQNYVNDSFQKKVLEREQKEKAAFIKENSQSKFNNSLENVPAKNDAFGNFGEINKNLEEEGRGISSAGGSSNGNENPLNEKSKKPLTWKAGAKVYYVNAIFNGSNTDTLKTEIEKFLKDVEEKNIELGNVYLLGGGKKIITREQSEKIWLAGGQLREIYSLPIKYEKIKTAPAWIVATDGGEIILEGMNAIGKFFNGDGEYLGEKIS